MNNRVLVQDPPYVGLLIGVSEKDPIMGCTDRPIRSTTVWRFNVEERAVLRCTSDRDISAPIGYQNCVSSLFRQDVQWRRNRPLCQPGKRKMQERDCVCQGWNSTPPLECSAPLQATHILLAFLAMDNADSDTAAQPCGLKNYRCPQSVDFAAFVYMFVASLLHFQGTA